MIPERGETNEVGLTFSLVFCLEAFLDHNTVRGPNQNTVASLVEKKSIEELREDGVAGICRENGREIVPEICRGIFLTLLLNAQPQRFWEKNKWEDFS